MTSFIDDDGNELDYNGKDFSMSKQSLSLINFKIKGDVSVNIKLPNNAKNRAILNIYDRSQLNGAILSRQRFTQVVDGNKVTAGYLAIIKIEDEEFEGFFISGNSNWMNLLAFNIKEIQLNEDSVIINRADENKTKTSGIIFPIIDVAFQGNKVGYAFYSFLWNDPGTPTNGANLSGYLTENIPCYYMHSLVSGISRHSNVKINGTLLNDPIFKKLIITPDSMQLMWPDNQIEDSRAFVTPSAQSALDPGIFTLIMFDTVIDSGKLQCMNTSNQTWIAPYRCSLDVKLDLYFTASQVYTVALYLNGILYVQQIMGTSTNKFNQTLFIDNVAANDSVSVYVKGAGVADYKVDCKAQFKIRKEIFSLPRAEAFPNRKPLVCPQAIIPNVKATEIIKNLCLLFNMVPTYDVASNTITLDKVESIRKEDALDWSDYFVSSEEDYKDIAKHNYVKWKTNVSDPYLEGFNKTEKKGYGGADIETPYNATEEKTIQELLFSSTRDFRNDTLLAWMMPSIPYWTLEDDEEFAYTSVTGSSNPTFNGTGWHTVPNCVIRIADDNGIYDGYTGASLGPSSVTPLMDFVSNSTGSIFTQRISENTPGHRLLLVQTEYSLSNLGVIRASMSGQFGLNGVTSIPYAWFDKEKIDRPLDTLKTSLAFDSIQNKGYNQTLRDLFWGKLNKILSSPKIPCKMRLPLFEFARAQSNKFIFLKTQKMIGYFYLDSINAYKNASEEVTVNLYSID